MNIYGSGSLKTFANIRLCLSAWFELLRQARSINAAIQVCSPVLWRGGGSGYTIRSHPLLLAWVMWLFYTSQSNTELSTPTACFSLTSIPFSLLVREITLLILYIIHSDIIFEPLQTERHFKELLWG